MKAFAYVAIRRESDSGREWMDLDSISGLIERCQDKANDDNAKCGKSWAKANPLARIARVTITEQQPDAQRYLFISAVGEFGPLHFPLRLASAEADIETAIGCEFTERGLRIPPEGFRAASPQSALDREGLYFFDPISAETYCELKEV